MAESGTDREFVTSSHVPVDQVDPHGYLRLQMRVIGAQSKTLGTIETLERDEATGSLKALTVSHGFLRRSTTSVPADRVKWVNDDSVVLDITPKRFKALPKMDDR